MSRRLLFALSIGVLLSFPAVSEHLTAAPQASSGVSALRARAQSSGRVRVIVGARVTQQPETALRDALSIDAQRMQTRQTVQTILTGRQGGSVERVKVFDTLPFFAADVDAPALDALASSPLVSSIEQDTPLPRTLSESVPLIGAPEAWAAGATGAGWTVAVLDSGVESTHPFLTGKVVAEACFSTTSVAWSSTSLCPGGTSTATAPGSAGPCSSAVDGCDHGTHIAGIIAGSNPTFSGVARDATIFAIQVFSQFDPTFCGGGMSCVMAWQSDVIAGLDHVYALRASFNVAAVNLSVGSNAVYSSACDELSPSMKAAVDNLTAARIAAIISAGNTGSTSGLSFPSCLSNAVSVGSTTKADVVSSFSNTGTFLSLLAPGESIFSSLPGGVFGSRSGTSTAAPHVAGAWALLRQHKPSATVSEILQALQATGRPVADSRPGGHTFARIQVNAALGALAVPTPRLTIDAPSTGMVVEPLRVAGWAIDEAATTGTGIDAVHVWAYPAGGGAPTFVGAANLSIPRDDVAAAFGAQFMGAGYLLNASTLPPGSYTLVASAHSAVSNSFGQPRSVAVTIPSSAPSMSVDAPANGSTIAPAFTVAGWAVDRVAPAGTGVDAVHIWAFPTTGGDPVFVGAAVLGVARPDVGAAFGGAFAAAGYSLAASGLAPGKTYDLGVYAHSTVSGTFNQMKMVRVSVQ